jgi:hypothetical protein
MFSGPSSRLFSAIAWCLCAFSADAGTNLTVSNTKGQTIGIELMALDGDSVTFCRPGNPKEYTLPISSFDETSQKLIRQEAAKLPVALPKIKPEVVIGKRRKKGDSYYMVRQEITTKVKLTNLSTRTPVPPIKATVVYIGQNRRTPSVFTILSKQSFETSIEPAATTENELKTFSTSYDSDNKGQGNIGGFQYFGYILAIRDDQENIVLTDISAASIRQELADKPTRLKELLELKKGQTLTEKMTPAKKTVGSIID